MIIQKKRNYLLKNKNGFLLAEETLKVVLSVIAILILAYLLYALYKSNKESQELEFAKSSLDILIKEINSEKNEVDIYNPKEWVINSWPNYYKSGFLFWENTHQGIPLTCTNLGWSSCICICDANSPKSCDLSGACLENLGGLKFEQPIVIENPPLKLIIDHQNKIIKK